MQSPRPLSEREKELRMQYKYLQKEIERLTRIKGRVMREINQLANE